jgi:hypothetical protein
MERTTLKDVALFNGQPQEALFSNVKCVLPVRRMEPAALADGFDAGVPIDLPPVYSFDSHQFDSTTFF